MNDLFRRFANQASTWAGSPQVFVMAVSLVVGWALLGPVFGYSDTWQLVINTTTTIITFLMVFLIQNTQNRDGKAMQLKLDELIRVSKTARNTMLDLEELDEKELDRLHEEFKRFADDNTDRLNSIQAKLKDVKNVRK
ncbi:MAG: low affinity iron permease family protein [Proteobacteria bacterium]|nr:MAG: low affinity iron permease family protein [Pseudomonadota bacterium]